MTTHSTPSTLASVLDNAFVNQTLNEKGAPCYTADGMISSSRESLGESQVPFDSRLNRGLSKKEVQEHLHRALAEGRSKNRVAEMFGRLLKQVLYTRDIRKGKGERNISHLILRELLREIPEATTSLVKQLPLNGFGSYKDWFQLVKMCDDEGEIEQTFRRTMLDAIAAQLKADEETMLRSTETDRQSISLLAKWCPREKSGEFKGLVGGIADRLFPNEPNLSRCTTDKEREVKRKKTKLYRRTSYRKLVSKLTRYLKTVVEPKMSQKLYDEVHLKNIHAKAFQKYRRYFQNQKQNGKPRVELEMDLASLVTNTSGSNMATDQNATDSNSNQNATDSNLMDPDVAGYLRMVERIKKSLEEARLNPTAAKTINVNGLMVHELVKHYYNLLRRKKPEDVTEDPAIEAAFAVLTEKLERSDLKIVFMLDVSGSMDGLPMNVCIALGIMLSAIQPEPWRNRALSFDGQPSWIKLLDGGTLLDKVKTLMAAPWGGSTNFELAMDVLREACTTANLTQNQIPEMLCVITDMNWDSACSGKMYDAKKIRKQWRKMGYGYKPPHILLWNVRSDGQPVYNATTDTLGVATISGYSQQVFQAFTQGMDFENLQNETPLQALDRMILKDRYNSVVDQICLASNDPKLQGYQVTVTEEIVGSQ